MWVFVPRIDRDSLMAYWKRWLELLTRMKLCNCKFYMRSTRQMVKARILFWWTMTTRMNERTKKMFFFQLSNEQASIERGRTTKKFQHVLCERCWQDSWTSRVRRRDNFWLSSRAIAKMKTKRNEWLFWQLSQPLTRTGDITSFLIYLKSFMSLSHANRQLLSSSHI